MPIASLVLASPVSCVATRRRARSLRGPSAGSVVVLASVAIGVGLGYVGVVAAAVATSMLVVLCFAVACSRSGQRWLHWQSARRARARRESTREHALDRATLARHEQYLELRGIVESVERSDPAEAQQLELQGLLDNFVQLAVGHQRCMESLRVAGGCEWPTTAQLAVTTDTTRRRDLAARRQRHREEIEVRLRRIADELDSADELIRLVAQRAACARLGPLLDGAAGEIERRLAELDEIAEEAA